MAYKGKSAVHVKGIFDAIKRTFTAKKVIKQDLESKSNPFIESTKTSDVRVKPGEGRGFYSMPEEEYIKQASKVYRKTGLKPTEQTRRLDLTGNSKDYSYFELPQSKKINIELGERSDHGRREIEMSVEKIKENKPKKVKVKTPKVKTPKATYNIGKKGKQKLYKGWKSI